MMRATQKGLQKCQKHQTYLLEGQNCGGMSQKGLQVNRMHQTRAQAHTVHKHMQSIESNPGTLVNTSASLNLLARGTKLLVGKPEMDKMDAPDMHTRRETWEARVYLQTC